MRIAIIREGVVVNVIIASQSYEPGDGALAVPAGLAGPGWTYQHGILAPPDGSPVAFVPECIAMWQARAVLKAAPGNSQGRTLLDEANALVAASNNPALEAFWEFSPQLHRASPTLDLLAKALGLTSEDIDLLFRNAATLAL